MKKLLLLVVLGILVALAFPVANLVIAPDNRGVLAKLRPVDADYEAVPALLEKHCAGCHVPDAELPFYASFPIAKGIMAADIELGLRHLDLKEAFSTPDAPISEVTLAKIEHVVQAESMPPFRYVAMHWDAPLSGEEEELLLDWIADKRTENYVTGTAAAAFATAAIQPLVTPEGLDPALVDLGKRLYHDVRLSGDDTLSCATCHDLGKGGTDQIRFSEGIDGQFGGINAPTVYNSSFMLAQFWDGRAADLVEQAGGPVANPIEMGAEWPDVVAKLKQDDVYVQDFAAHFDDGITALNTQRAIAHFEESLVTVGSDFDAYLMGQEDAISADARAGYELFTEHGCATCHTGAALGGGSFELFGLQGDYFADRGEEGEADHGRFNFTHEERDRHRFKVPTLRNIAVTFPYFHDGSTSDLAEAVRVMGTYQRGKELSDAETAKIVAFLQSLTGTYDGVKLQ